MVIKRIYKPKNDDEFLGQVAKIIFVAGFRYSIVDERWPLIKKAFLNFSINKLSKFKDKDIEKLMKSKGMIKNKGKIEAIIFNAQDCKNIIIKYSSILKWIKKVKLDYSKDPLFNPSLEESFMRFKRIGKTTAGWLSSLHNAKGTYIEYDPEK